MNTAVLNLGMLSKRDTCSHDVSRGTAVTLSLHLTPSEKGESACSVEGPGFSPSAQRKKAIIAFSRIASLNDGLTVRMRSYFNVLQASPVA